MISLTMQLVRNAAVFPFVNDGFPIVYTGQEHVNPPLESKSSTLLTSRALQAVMIHTIARPYGITATPPTRPISPSSRNSTTPAGKPSLPTRHT
jgi:hypothetical protein